MTTMNAIAWPEEYLPGTTDNFVSNEQFVRGLSSTQVWPKLIDTSAWPTYYDNVSDLTFPDGGGPELQLDLPFAFSTFGFPPLAARVVAFEEPSAGRPGRLSWTAVQGRSPDERFEALHAWLIEDLPGIRLRILTQESQRGQPAADLAQQRPNPMLNGHQAWIDGLIEAARNG